MSPNYSAATAPCPYVVDGVMLTIVATPGQNSLWVVTTPSPPDTFGVVEIQQRETGATARYTIPRAAQEFLDAWTEP